MRSLRKSSFPIVELPFPVGVAVGAVGAAGPIGPCVTVVITFLPPATVWIALAVLLLGMTVSVPVASRLTAA
jgi:hypothetical protein